MTLLDVVDGRAPVKNVILPGPGGVHLVCGASGNSRLADLSPATLEALGRELLNLALDFDVLIIDTGAGISNAVTHFLGLAQDSIVVATPGLASILDAYGVIKLSHENRLPTRIHLLINQAETPEQAETVRERIAGCADRFLASSLHTFGYLDRDPLLEQSTQTRRPLMIGHPGSPNAMRIQTIAGQLMEGVNSGRSTNSDPQPQPQPVETASAAA